MKVLFETEKLELQNSFEATFLTDRESSDTLMEIKGYGDPVCGLIDMDNKWAIVAGEFITIWTLKNWKRLDNEDLK